MPKTMWIPKLNYFPETLSYWTLYTAQVNSSSNRTQLRCEFLHSGGWNWDSFKYELNSLYTRYHVPIKNCPTSRPGAPGPGMTGLARSGRPTGGMSGGALNQMLISFTSMTRWGLRRGICSEIIPRGAWEERPPGHWYQLRSQSIIGAMPQFTL